MLDFILCHGLGDECDVYFFAFLEHSFRAGGSARINIDLDITVLFENLVAGCLLAVGEGSPLGDLVSDAFREALCPL